MEKRFALFLVLSALILFLSMTLQNLLQPPRQVVPQEQQEPVGDGAAPEQHFGEAPAAGQRELTEVEAPPADVRLPDPIPDEPAIAADLEQPTAAQRVTLGSLAADSPYRLLVTLNNRGAAVERIELSRRTPAGQFRFRELDRSHGYLGYLAVDAESAGGCRVQVVGPGTPAALARTEQTGMPPGLQAGDLIQQIDDVPIEGPLDYERVLTDTRPGQVVRIAVSRVAENGATNQLVFLATLTYHPLGIIHPEVNQHAETNQDDPLSFLLTMQRIGDKSIQRGEEEIAGLPSLRQAYWELQELDDDGITGPGFEFRRRLAASDLQRAGLTGALEIVKRYRLARTPDGETDSDANRAYHLSLEIEIHNRGDAAQQVAYQLDGANGLPLEGWWYSNKTHPRRFSAVGARDIVWSTPKSGHSMIGCPQIYSEAKEAQAKSLPTTIPLFPPGQQQVIDYVGVDAQYFSVVLLTDREDPVKAAFEQASAMPAGPLGEKRKQWVKTTNTTFRLDSPSRTLEPGQVYAQRFTIFAGPKQPAVLEQYGLEELIAFGWFPWIARPLSWILHFFAGLPLVNYGLAIILLTVLVRSAMMPLSRKAAKNAQMMQELAPEMKRIAEKYKSDMEKRAAAQRELFARHNYNPFGGCLLMFVQLPIFIGLYRALSVDIELLQAPLIPGLAWCSNLAGPDMLWYWQPHLPELVADFIADPGVGWLGPYFNVLPMVTIVLFLVQQKMFMPPATDDQTRLQHQMMKFMMIFMGVLFFRVPSGLCVYFIASSLWGIAERKLLPPPVKPGSAVPSAGPQSTKSGTAALSPRDEKALAEGEAKKARIKKRQKKQ